MFLFINSIFFHHTLTDNLIGQPYWTALLYNLIVQPYCTALLYSLIVQSYCTTLLHSLIVQPYCTSGSHQAVIRQSSDSHPYTLNIEWLWISLHCTLYYITVTSRYTEALKLHCFLKKKSIQYISMNLTKCGFELHGFFLDPKTAHLEALLYI